MSVGWLVHQFASAQQLQADVGQDYARWAVLCRCPTSAFSSYYFYFHSYCSSEFT